MGFEKIRKSQNLTGYGFVLYKPDIPLTTNIPLIIFLHGIGGTGDGENSLDNLLNNEIPGNLKSAVQSTTRPFFLLAPQVTNYTGNEVDAMIAYSANLQVNQSKINLTGLSLGGGGTFSYIGSSLARAQKLSTAIPIATTWVNGTWKNVADAQLPVWAFHNINDTNGGTPVAATNGIVDAINANTNAFKAVKTLFNATGHGGWDTVYKDAPPIAPNGQGLLYPSVSIYEWMYMNSKDAPVAVPGSSGGTSLKAAAGPDRTVNAQTIQLDGSMSENFKPELSSWSAISVPNGVNLWDSGLLFPKGSGWYIVDAFMPKVGNYTYRLTVKDGKGGIATDDVTITYAGGGSTTSTTTTTTTTVMQSKIEEGRVWVNKIGKYVYVYEDGTTEIK